MPARMRYLLTLALMVVVVVASLPAVAAPGCGGEIDEKSRLGLMPPACGPAPDAPVAMTAAPATMFGPVIEATVASWPQVVTAVNLDNDPAAELPLLTDSYFAPATDRSLLTYDLQGSALVAVQQAAAGATPAAIAAVNGPSGPIVAAALAGSHALAVYTGSLPLNGPYLLPQPGAPDAVTFADVNGDLRPDIVVVSPDSDTITFRDPLRAGMPVLLRLPFATDGFSALRAGDLDNNGFEDVVVLRGAGYASDSVVVLLQEGGSFARRVTLSPATGGFLPHSLAVGDLNGDGRDDIAVVAGGNVPNAFLSLFIQTDSGFAAVPPLPAFHIPGAVAIADVTHDGRNDVVVFHHAWRTLSVYVQQVDGRFAEPVTTTVPYSGARRPDSLTVADVNGDGGLDAALASRVPGLTVLLNTAGAPTATITSPEPATRWPAGPLAVRGTASASAVRVEVRIKGVSDWSPATLSGGSWQADLFLPEAVRPYTIEARAIDANGRVQAPPAQVRVQVAPLLVGYAVADNGEPPGPGDRLVRFDPETGAATLIGATGTDYIHAITFLPGTNTLIAANLDRLGTIDLATGRFTPLPQRFGTGRNGRATRTFTNAHGLTPDPRDGMLFAVMRLGNGQPDVLFKLNPATGAYVPNAFGAGKDFVLVTGAGVGEDIDDLVFDPATNTLYAIANVDGRQDKLVTIDPATGIAAVIGSLGVENMEGLALAPNGVLYGSTGSSRPATRDRLWTINRATGTATLVGPFGIESDYEAIAFLPPRVAAPAPATAPRLSTLTVNGAALATSASLVTIQGVAANSDPSSNARIIEYVFDASQRTWQPHTGGAQLASAGIPVHVLEAGIQWRLAQNAGARYIVAGIVDDNGQPLAPPACALINYLPSQFDIAAGEVAVFHYHLTAGDQLEVQLESLQGDADVVIWSSDSPENVWVSNVAAGNDHIFLTAPLDGLYQIEVYGQTASTVRLRIDRIARELATPRADASAGIDARKALPSAPVVDLAAIPASLIPDPVTPHAIYIPLVGR